MTKKPVGTMGLREILCRDYGKFCVGITGLKNPMADPVRMTACFLRVSIINPPPLAI